MKISVVIPVYNSISTLKPLTQRIGATLQSVGEFELVFVDDGSSAPCFETLKEIKQSHSSNVQIIQLMRNYGQHNALMCGFRASRGDVIVTLDDDLQNPPEEIPKLLRKLNEGNFDLVYGNCESKKQASWRNLGSKAINFFFKKVFGISVPLSSFRAIRRPLLNSILDYDKNFTFIDGLLAWNTTRIGETKVQHEMRAFGESGYTIGKLLLLSLNLFTNFSLVPLQLVSLSGLITAIGGIGVAFYYLIQFFLANITVPGYASTIVSILILGGVQLLALGIIGEYLGRLHLNVNQKPQYTVRSYSEKTPLSMSAARGDSGHKKSLDPKMVELLNSANSITLP